MASAADQQLLDTIEPPAGQLPIVDAFGSTGAESALKAVEPPPPPPAKEEDLTAPAEPKTATPTVTQPPGPMLPPGNPVTDALISGIIGAEGTGKNPLSTAQGTGQFLDRTWLGVTMGEPEVVGKTPAQILAMKSSPNPEDRAFARRMVAKYASHNAEILQNAGLPVTDANIYLAHFLGPAGAVKVLRAPPDTPIAQIIGQAAIAANPQLAGMTASSTINYVAGALRGRKADGTAPAAADSDPAFTKWKETQQAGIDRLGQQIEKLTEAATREAPGSTERQEMLRRAMEHSEELQRRFERISAEPPKRQTPFEAAGEMTPLLIGLVSLAGAFTRRPALGAMNALGSALGALKQGNDENYKRAYDLWVKQSDLAHTAFKMQNEQIDTILRDRQISERERQDRLQNAFRVLGLTNDLEMAKSNMWEKVYKRQDDRQKLALDFEEKRAKIALDLARAAQARIGGTNPVMVEYTKAKAAFVAANQRDPSETEDKALFEEALGKARGSAQYRGTEKGYIDDALKAEVEKRGLADVEALPADVKRDVTKQAHQEWAQAGQTGRTAGSMEGQLLQTITDRMKAQNRAAGRPEELTPEQQTQAAAEAATFRHRAGVTGNKVVDLQNMVDQISYGLNAVDETLNLMARNRAITGIGGRVTRPAESVLNVIGLSNDADRRDFESHIHYLRFLAPRLLSGSLTRPLAAESKHVDSIVRGLELGSTSAATNRSLMMLRQLLTDSRQQHLSQLAGTWRPPDTATAPGTHSPFTGQPPAAQAPPTGAPPPAATQGFDAFPDAR